MKLTNLQKIFAKAFFTNPLSFKPPIPTQIYLVCFTTKPIEIKKIVGSNTINGYVDIRDDYANDVNEQSRNLFHFLCSELKLSDQRKDVELNFGESESAHLRMEALSSVLKNKGNDGLDRESRELWSYIGSGLQRYLGINQKA
jgi:hypothetical protein